MTENRVKPILIAAAVVSSLVFIAEMHYWLTHSIRPGPSGYIALCGLGIILIAAAQLIKKN